MLEKYTGTTTVSAGVLSLNSAGAPSVLGNFVMNGADGTYARMQQADQFGPGVVANFTSAWGAWNRFELLGKNQTFAGINTGDATTQGGGVIQIGEINNTTGSNATLTLNGSGNYTYNGHLRNGGSSASVLSLVKNGTGTQTLVGNKVDYTGSTSVNQGVLVLNNATGFASSTTTVGSAGTLALNSTNTAVDNWRLNTVLAGTGVINVNNGTAGWVQTGSNVHTFGGTLNILAGTFGTSFLTSNWSGVTATVNVSAGALLDARGQAITIGALNGAGTVGTTWTTAATVNLGAGNQNGAFTGVIAGNATSATNLTGNPNAGVLSLVKTGTGTQTLSGANTYSGSTTINGGVLQIGGSGTLGSGAYAGTLANNAVFKYSSSANQTLSGIVSGAGSFVKDTGAGTLTLTGANTYTGATTVNAGTLVLSGLTGGSNNGNVSGNQLSTTGLSVGAGATAVINVGSANFSSANTGLTVSGAGVLKLASNKWWLGNGGGGTAIAMAAGGWMDVQSGATLTNDYANANWSGNNGSLNVSGNFDLRNNNTVVDALTGSGAIYDNGYTNTLTLGVAGTTNNATYGVAGNTATFGGTLGVGGTTLSLIKNGAGTQILSGSNTYTGGTTVNGGTLLAGSNSAFGTGAVTVNSGGRLHVGFTGAGRTLANAVTVNNGGTLMGAATLNGAVTINSGATLSPGAAIGKLTFGNGVTLASGAAYLWEITGMAPSVAGTDFDQIAVTAGTMNINSGATLKIYALGIDYTGSFWDQSQMFTIATKTGTGTITGSFGTIDTSLAGAYSAEGAWSLLTAGNGDIQALWTASSGMQGMSLQAVPEPSTYGLVGTAALGLAATLRRRRKKTTTSGV